MTFSSLDDIIKSTHAIDAKGGRLPIGIPGRLQIGMHGRLRRYPQAKYSFGPWLMAAARRPHRNILTIALANKLARIALTVLVQGRSYESRIVPAAA